MNTFPLKIENSASIFALNQCYSTVQEILAISIRNKVVFADNITFHGFPGCSAGKESACNAGDLDSIPGLGRSPGEVNSSPLQYSGLENSMDCIVHGVAKSRTRLITYAHITGKNLFLKNYISYIHKTVSFYIDI